jgi:putative molybdopterin biosynthesis protein
MDKIYLYHKIAETLRQQILEGDLKPGDRLPPVREMAQIWNCTVGTIQRAYQDLAKQGLLISRAGQGTKVVENIPATPSTVSPLRYASLIHRAEAYLLEMLTAGFELPEIEDGMRQAMDRWRSVSPPMVKADESTIRFSGSHDLVITWLASHFQEITNGYHLSLQFVGSLGGLIALAENTANIAGSHLWDQTSDTFNTPYVSRIMPGRRVALITVAYRRLGLIIPTDNPENIQGIEDIARDYIRFVNRQPGSGTRVWLDAFLKDHNISTNQILGYNNEKTTHSAVARAIAEGEADLGVGLEAAARSYGLGFLWLRNDRYDLVIPDTQMEQPPIKALVDWLNDNSTREFIASLGGYDTRCTGCIEWVE